MKIVVTGSLGHIGKPLTQELLDKGHVVTVVSSNPEKQSDIEALGASAAIGTLQDVDFLTATFAGADLVYTMVPPGNFADPNLDLMAYWTAIGNNFAQAIGNAGVKRAIHLSSIGAHMPTDSGLIAGHYQLEQILGALNDVDITFMRPVAFYYNLMAFIPVIKSTGNIMSNYGGDDRVGWVSPIDIASAIADEIATAPAHRKVRYVASEEPSCNEIASILGNAIGKPDMKWLLISNEQLQKGMEAAGVSPAITAGLVEMNAAIHNGKLYEDYYQHRPVMGKVKLAGYANEFAAVYNK